MIINILSKMVEKVASNKKKINIQSQLMKKVVSNRIINIHSQMAEKIVSKQKYPKYFFKFQLEGPIQPPSSNSNMMDAMFYQFEALMELDDDESMTLAKCDLGCGPDLLRLVSLFFFYKFSSGS